MAKYDYKITDLDALASAYPQATIKTPNRQELRKIVNAARTLNLTIPGVEFLAEEAEEEKQLDLEDVPEHMKAKDAA